jgi:hypothetical protein
MRFNFYQALSYLRLPLPTTCSLVQPRPCRYLRTSLTTPGHDIDTIMVVLNVFWLAMTDVGSMCLGMFLALLFVIYFGMVARPAANVLDACAIAARVWRPVVGDADAG